MGEGDTRRFCTEIVHFLSKENWHVGLLEFTAECGARYIPFKFQNPGGEDHQKMLYMVRPDISVRVEVDRFTRASGQSCTWVPGNECRNPLRLEYRTVQVGTVYKANLYSELGRTLCTLESSGLFFFVTACFHSFC
jgi:hypothetical protein